MTVERRGQPGTGTGRQQQWKSDLEPKQYAIARQEVTAAWERVRAKGGAGGIDGESVASFEENLTGNLYKLWNRMSSGSYHPQAVQRVEIPKADGSVRLLGIPTIMDRVAQAVVRARLEPVVERVFHPDSYGYRPKKQAVEAVGICRKRCWRYDWVLDIDIQKFFDSIDHELMLKAVRHHTQLDWMVLYIERWLKAPVAHRDGRREPTERGTPQGGVISPLLANLYLHYAFDAWMGRQFPDTPFERYADDIVVHCRTEQQARHIEQALRARLLECGLTLHPEKTKLVYCRDEKRTGQYPNKTFTFLGYSFMPRRAPRPGSSRTGTGFLPAVSTAAAKRFRFNLKRRGIFRRHQISIQELADLLNPRIAGWYQYFSHFYRSELQSMTMWLDSTVVRWLRDKHKMNWASAGRYLLRLASTNPTLFAHWRYRLPGRAV